MPYARRRSAGNNSYALFLRRSAEEQCVGIVLKFDENVYLKSSTVPFRYGSEGYCDLPIEFCAVRPAVKADAAT